MVDYFDKNYNSDMTKILSYLKRVKLWEGPHIETFFINKLIALKEDKGVKDKSTPELVSNLMLNLRNRVLFDELSKVKGRSESIALMDLIDDARNLEGLK